MPVRSRHVPAVISGMASSYTRYDGDCSTYSLGSQQNISIRPHITCPLCRYRSDGRFHIGCRKSHCGDKTILRISYLDNGISCTCKTTIFNSLGPSDAIWRWRSGSTLIQVMACCLTAPSHYLNQCWLIIGKVLWHSSEDIIIRFEDTNQ